MNYQKIYDDLISRAKIRTKPDGYVEKHHVIPRCLGGGDEIENIVVLTGREHFVAHLLLLRLNPDNYKLICTIHFMSRFTHIDGVRHYYVKEDYIKSRKYAAIRAKYAEAASIRFKGVPRPPHVGIAVSLAQTGRPRTEEWKAAVSKKLKGKKRSPEMIKKSAASRTGLKRSEESILNMKKAQQARRAKEKNHDI